MTTSLAPINFQRLRPKGIGLVSQRPVLAVYSSQDSAIEGATLFFRVERTVNALGPVSFNFLILSVAGTGDFSSATSGTLTIADRVLSTLISVDTVKRADDQGDRQITCQISNAGGANILPGGDVASCTLSDFIDGGDPWYKQLAYRSDQPMAMGVTHFEVAPNHYTLYETARPAPLPDVHVDELDAFGGFHFGPSLERVATWDLVQGGPLGLPDSIYNNGQLSWFDIRDEFSAPFVDLPDKCWILHFFSLFPTTLRTDGATNRSAGWDAINSGDHDQRFKDFGHRVVVNFVRAGKSLDHYIACPWPNMNSAGVYYRVYPSTKAAFKSAFERIMGLMNEGANATLRFAFCPTQDSHAHESPPPAPTTSFGALSTWAPAGIDAVGMQFHPAGGVTSKATYDRLITGDTNVYGLVGDLKALADNRTIPMLIHEWSPTFATCPIADDVYGYFYDEFLVTYADQLVTALVYHNNTLLKGSAVGQTPAGQLAWDNGVDVFRENWGGIVPTLPEAVLTATAPTGSVLEGGSFNFTVVRDSAATKACSVHWAITDIGGVIADDVSSILSGDVAFLAGDSGVLSKTVFVQTKVQTGLQGNRTLRVTLSSPTACSIKSPGYAERVLVDNTSGLDPVLELYHNPFSKNSAHHRGMGANATFQAMQGKISGGASAVGTVYAANIGPVFDFTGATLPLSPLVHNYTALPNSGNFGRFTCKAGSGGIKYVYFVPNADAKHNPFTIYQQNSKTNTTDEWPLKDYAGSSEGGDPALDFPTGGGDNVMAIFPEVISNASDSNSNYLTFNNVNHFNAASAGDDPLRNCRTVAKHAISGLDWKPGGSGGQGGSGIWFPSCFLREQDFHRLVMTDYPTIAYIGHALQGTITRHNSPGDKASDLDKTYDVDENPPKACIMMGYGVVWPAGHRDGSAGATQGANDKPLGYTSPFVAATPGNPAHGRNTWPNGIFNNAGWIAYGQCLSIPDQLLPVWLSTTGSPVVIGGVSYALNLSLVGKALFWAIADFGFIPLDGSGQPVDDTTVAGTANLYGRMELRVDQGIFNSNAGLYDEIDTELGKICPPIGSPNYNKNLLFPVGQARGKPTLDKPWGTSDPEIASGKTTGWRGGGGPRRTGSMGIRNIAYDFTAE